MNFKADDICVTHSLPRHMAHFNGEECSIINFIANGESFTHRGKSYTAKEAGCCINTRHGELIVSPSQLRKKPSLGDQSVQEIWNDLIHRLTEGVPA